MKKVRGMIMEPIIKVEHLSKEFGQKGSGVHALNDVSLSIEKGDIYGIIGMSGAGKSTFVRCLNLLERPTSWKCIHRRKRPRIALRARASRGAHEYRYDFSAFQSADAKKRDRQRLFSARDCRRQEERGARKGNGIFEDRRP